MMLFWQTNFLEPTPAASGNGEWLRENRIIDEDLQNSRSMGEPSEIIETDCSIYKTDIYIDNQVIKQ